MPCAQKSVRLMTTNHLSPEQIAGGGMLTHFSEHLQTVHVGRIALELLAQGHGKRRGRPPAWMSAQIIQIPKPDRLGEPTGENLTV